MKTYPLALLLAAITLSGCSEDDCINPSAATPNILLIIADDLGKDAISGYAEGTSKPNTPNIDAIRNGGLTFNNFWVYPSCSPTRASIITGKYGYRTGVKWASDAMSASENILQRYISEQTNGTYSTAIVGKWHLSGENATFNPESLGLDHYVGLVRGAVQDYYQWQMTEDGNTSLQTEYTTKVFTDRSIDWVQDQTKPWFLWLAFNAPHTPFHVPPSEMHSQGNLPDYVNGVDPLPYYFAAIEAMDHQIGRLLDSIPANERENTLIIFIGDNGSPGQAAQSPYATDRAKGTLYQGGINVPMFISGAGVSRTGTDDNLISSTDLFATISEMAGISVSEINDSRSFKSLLTMSGQIRDFHYSEMNNGTLDAWTISNGAFKLTTNSSGEKQFYDLTNDPYEQSDLLMNGLTTEAQSALLALEEELLRIRD